MSHGRGSHGCRFRCARWRGRHRWRSLPEEPTIQAPALPGNGVDCFLTAAFFTTAFLAGAFLTGLRLAALAVPFPSGLFLTNLLLSRFFLGRCSGACRGVSWPLSSRTFSWNVCRPLFSFLSDFSLSQPSYLRRSLAFFAGATLAAFFLVFFLAIEKSPQTKLRRGRNGRQSDTPPAARRPSGCPRIYAIRRPARTIPASLRAKNLAGQTPSASGQTARGGCPDFRPFIDL